MKPEIFEMVENLLINAFADGILDGESTIDMHHIVYNQSETYVYTADAERDLERIGTFNAIQAVMTYEQDNFGRTAPAEQYGNACWVANMIVYILGEALIAYVFGDDPDWQNDSDITPEIAQRYAELLDEVMAAEPDLVSHLWQN
jgi:hypothetical protein|nr:MAG TPA: hypothetical protein [Caudoviricetes sp.]